MSEPLWLELAVWTLPPALGAAVLTLLGVRPRDDRLAYLGWAYLAGCLAWGAVLWLALLVGLRYLPLIAAASVAAVAAALVQRLRRTPRQGSPAQTVEEGSGTALRPGRGHAAERNVAGNVERVLAGAGVALCLVVALDGVLLGSGRSVIEDDEAQIWAAKAKVLYLAGGFNLELQELLAGDSIVYHPDYPLLNPLLQLGTFVLAGGVVERENRLVIQGVFLALVLVLAAALRRSVRPAVAAVLLFLTVTAPAARLLVGHGNADTMVALGQLVMLDSWRRLCQSGEARWWRLTTLGAAFALGAKNEGLMLTGLVAAAVVAAALGAFGDGARWRLPAPREAWWLLAPALVAAANVAVNRFYGARNDLFAGGFLSRLSAQLDTHGPVVARHFAEKLVADPAATQLFFVLFAGFLLLFPRRTWRSALGPPAAVLLLALAGYSLIYVATYHDLGWHLRTSSSRVLFHLLPTLAAWLGAAAAATLPGTAVAAAGGAPALTAPRAGAGSSGSPL